MEPQPYSDQQMMALVDIPLFKDPQIKCPSGSITTWLCLNPNCQTSLFCSNNNCQHCSGKHDSCRVTKLSGLTSDLNLQGNSYKDMFYKIIQIDNFIINQLKRSQKEFFRQYHIKNFAPQQKRTISNLYNVKNGKMSGKEALLLKEGIEKVSLQSGQDMEKKLNEYKKQVDGLSASIIRLKQKMLVEKIQTPLKIQLPKEKVQTKKSQKKWLEKITPEPKKQSNKKWILKKQSDQKQQSPQIPETKLTPIQPNFMANPQILKHQNQHNSKIIDTTTKEGRKKFNFLKSQLGNSKLQLLFRASEHEFSAYLFHQICDNIHDTVILVKTDSGKTIAGFTHHKWNQVKKGYVEGNTNSTFLLQLDYKQKYVAKQGTHLIYCNVKSGPIFGKGHDLCILDKCNVNDCFANFPTTFNLLNGEQYPEPNINSYTIFTGSIDVNFRVVEYEVFRVILDKSFEKKLLKEENKDKKVPQNPGPKAKAKKDEGCRQ